MTTQQLPTEPISYDGKLGEQYKIFFVNVFLGLITLGIYHYWGKTRQRRYTTSSFSIFNDRMEYTGYGGQLFWGMIKALVIILIFSIPLFWAIDTISTITEQAKKEQSTQTTTSEKANSNTQRAAKDSTEENEDEIKIDFDKLSDKDKTKYISAISLAAFYAVFFYAFLPFVAVFGSLRFRVTHTRWRGIRGHMTGSVIPYGLVGLFHLLLKIITLGLWIPIADGMMYKYKMNRISFGNQQAVFKPDYGQLFGSHLLTLFAGSIIGLGVGIVVGIIAYGIIPEAHAAQTLSEQADSVHKVTAASAAISIGVLAFFACMIIARFWYRATFVRMRYNQLKFGNIGFDCRIPGWGLFTQLLGNALILIFTLGFGYPIVIQRRMKFFCKHTKITGDINQSAILQAAGEKDKAGEGVSSILDINIGLF